MKRIIEVAEKEIGETEFPKNSNLTKYGEWFGFDGVPWCGIFVSWVYHVAGFPLGNIGFRKGFAGCQTAVAHFKRTNEIVENPQEGDIFFVDWNNDGRYDHVGIFKRDLGNGTFETIEGNTSVGNDSNGGQVMLRIRHFKAKYKCLFVHPKVLNS